MNRAMLSIVILALVCASAAAEEVPTGSFAFSFTVELPADPTTAWEAATGDIGDWWDHSLSEHPYAMVIEPRPGGLFLETFDPYGDGVAHATVTYASKGEMLRMVGPLGLAGHALHMVTTWTFTPGEQEGTTAMTIEVHATGEVHEGWPEIVEATWHHFIEDRLARFLAGELE